MSTTEDRHLVTVGGATALRTASSQVTSRLTDPFGPPPWTPGGTCRLAPHTAR
ncbi:MULTISPECIES: hypothetical protein [Streptosporangium]|uniref:Uncharacterized protein n=1 Tax=Streptosporangium brasiliense TaxID=47480 RepID=A0ABT9R947_9ACTN|nr:hypothetical protein [Streptosporangium brasiliense]MDP9865402.1 hypothetical protein [Streptosporangium brasiliense]